MLSNITIGQYFPGNSLLHRLDPRTKLVVLFALIVALFLFDQPADYLVMSLLTLAAMRLSRVPLRTLVGSLNTPGAPACATITSSTWWWRAAACTRSMGRPIPCRRAICFWPSPTS